MNINVFLLSSLRRPFKSLLLLILLGLITFGFIAKAVGFILVQRETGVLGSYYRSIGVLENTKDPQSGDISIGIEFIQSSPYFAYGDQREMVSGVMSQTYNQNFRISNATIVKDVLPEEAWPNVHNTDIWFAGELVKKEEIKDGRRSKDPKTIGYYLNFDIDTLFAAYPEYATQGRSIGLLFLFEGNESVISSIEQMEIGQRYFIRGWEDVGFQSDVFWENTHFASLQLKSLNDGELWYIPLAEEESVDFSDPALASNKNRIDVLNENLHTLSIIATSDMSAMPKTQEASRYYYLTEGRWLNHDDDLSGNKVIVIPEELAKLRGFGLGDEIQLIFRPLTDTYFGYIRDGVDTLNWRDYPTYQDTFRIVGLYSYTNGSALFAFIPTNSLRSGFASTTQDQFKYEADYSFVLDSSRHEAEFIQEYQAPLQELGVSLTFLANNGPTYWASVDPIRRSSSADLSVFGMLMVVALSLTVFLYQTEHKRDYAILRALGVPRRQANRQLMLPLVLLGGLGITLGGLPAWNYALDKAKASLSTIPTPAGVYPSADISPFVLAGLCAAIFLVLILFSWLGMLLLVNKPVYELLQGQTTQHQKQKRINVISQPISSLNSSQVSTAAIAESRPHDHPVSPVKLARQRKYTPSSLSLYVIRHLLRSRLKSFLTLAIALGFTLASGWILQTMERSRMEVDTLYDTTIVEADIVPVDSSDSTGETQSVGSGFVYLKTIDSILNSGFVKSSVLEADTVWFKVEKFDSQNAFPGTTPVYAYDSAEAFYSGLQDPGSLLFAPGWNMDLFIKPQTLEDIQQDGLTALFPASLLQRLELNIGETVQITDQSSHTYSCVIVGQYSGGRSTTVNSVKHQSTNTTGDSILIPLSTLIFMDGSKTKFTVAHFILDPQKNRDLPQLRADMDKVIKEYGGSLRFMVWDEELRIVIAQLDKNISLLQVLYPVLIGVSILIGAGLCFLLLLQAAKEAAIMRVLGTTKTSVRLALIFEYLLISIVGVIIGLGVSSFMWSRSDGGQTAPLLVGAALYLAGVWVGLMVAAISITNKKPIELLQVKE